MTDDSRATPAAESRPEPHLNRWDWVAFVVALLAAFGVYFYTLAPTVTLEDSGELAVAGDYLGVPHPPGYPLWTIVVWIFSKVFSFVKYYGQPNPAWGIALASAVFGALAAGLTAMLISRSGRDMLRSIREAAGAAAHRMDGVICAAGGISGSLLFAFTPVMWSQSNIVEVYSLNAFFVALILLLAYLWMRRPTDHLLWWTALAFGLGLANWWPSVLLTLGPLVLVIMLKDLRLFRDFVAVGFFIFGMIAFNVVMGGLSQIQAPNDPGRPLYPWAAKLLWVRGPYSLPFWIYAAINGLAIGIGWRCLPRGRTVAWTFILAEIGVLVYLYMPLASDLRNPPMNWGYPRTWEGFLHAVGRGQYEKIAPTDVFTKQFVDQVGWYLSDLRCQYTLPIALVGFLPFVGWSLRLGRRRVNALLPSLVLVLFITVLVAIENYGGTGSEFTVPVQVGDATHHLRLFMLLAVPILGLLIIGFTALVLGEIRDLLLKMRGDSDTGGWERLLIGLAFAGALALLIYYEWHLAQLLWTADPPLSVTGKGIVAGMMFLPLFLAGAVAWLIYDATELRFDIDQDSQKWVIVTFVAFFLMGIVMVVGANPKGDIQDMFIQRVKFITSHEVYAFWLGYGLILGLAFVHRFLGSSPLVGWAGVAAVLALPVYPVLENAPFIENGFNRELLRTDGGADARGSDFGWQFGNYQLRGAKAILEELRPGEAPIPNPRYPPEMDPGAIFFGGTDPGRFVPTYMIYSARVREDVYLITQNALADHTYMSVMRDLYGDRIWIPSVADNNEAFRVFADQVRRGERPGNVDYRNGRVVVQGVEQVMAINGILCKMIHDKNKWRHSFYVEESYIIPWMYPYMEPHGLILKVNTQTLSKIPDAVVRDDMDFWAWYTRRLMRSRDFIYDAVARKTFSKLRSAIAGLYEYRGMWAEAERAYLQSALLCPVSPEAHFRLANMYMNLQRFDDARRLMERFSKQDPNNTRATAMIRQIGERKKLIVRKSQLEGALSKGGGQLHEVLELAQLYRQMGNTPGFVQLTRSVLENPQLPVDAHLQVLRWHVDAKLNDEVDRTARLLVNRMPSNAPVEVRARILKNVGEAYAVANKLPAAADALQKYLALVPLDVQAWHEVGVMYAWLNRHAEAVKALQQAVRLGGPRKREEIQKDGRMSQFAGRPEYQSLLRGGLFSPP